jgi:hypothetical protein
VELSPGESWIEHGGGTGLVCIRKGLVKKMLKRPLVISRFMREGEGLTLVSPDWKRVFVAIEPTVIEYIRDDAMEDLYALYPRLQSIAVRFMTKDMIDGRKNTDILSDADHERRYRQLVKYFPWLIVRVPQQDIADYLEMSPKMLEVISNRRQLKHS